MVGRNLLHFAPSSEGSARAQRWLDWGQEPYWVWVLVPETCQPPLLPFLSHPSFPGHLCPIPATALALSPRGLVMLFFHILLSSQIQTQFHLTDASHSLSTLWAGPFFMPVPLHNSRGHHSQEYNVSCAQHRGKQWLCSLHWAARGKQGLVLEEGLCWRRKPLRLHRPGEALTSSWGLLPQPPKGQGIWTAPRSRSHCMVGWGLMWAGWRLNSKRKGLLYRRVRLRKMVTEIREMEKGEERKGRKSNTFLIKRALPDPYLGSLAWTKPPGPGVSASAPGSSSPAWCDSGLASDSSSQGCGPAWLLSQVRGWGGSEITLQPTGPKVLRDSTCPC